MTLMYLSFSRTEPTFIGRDQGCLNTCSKFRGACRQTFIRPLVQTLPAQAGFTNMCWWIIPTGIVLLISAACKTGACDINWKLSQAWQKWHPSAGVFGRMTEKPIAPKSFL